MAFYLRGLLDAKRSIMEYPLWKSNKNEFSSSFLCQFVHRELRTGVSTPGSCFRFAYRDVMMMICNCDPL